MFTLKSTSLIRTLALAGLMLPTAAWAADRCEGSISNGLVDFGEVDVLSGRVNSVTVAVNITCTKDNISAPRRFHVCLGMDSGRWPTPKPVRLDSGDRFLCASRGQCEDSAPRIHYNLYTDGTYASIVGNVTPVRGKSNMLRTTIDIPAGQSSLTQTLTVYARMTFPQDLHLPPGLYQNPFLGGSTALIWNQDPNQTNCGHYNFGDGDVRVPFTVQATVPKKCYVEADELNFGTVPATREDIIGQTQMRVQCTQGTSYSIGLRSDNSLGEGEGAMQPLSGSSAAVPYTLHRSSPSDQDNNLWGYASNLRTSGRGDGTAQSYPVFGKVKSANYRPGRYQDTVRITVAY